MKACLNLINIKENHSKWIVLREHSVKRLKFSLCKGWNFTLCREKIHSLPFEILLVWRKSNFHSYRLKFQSFRIFNIFRVLGLTCNFHGKKGAVKIVWDLKGALKNVRNNFFFESHPLISVCKRFLRPACVSFFNTLHWFKLMFIIRKNDTPMKINKNQLLWIKK